MARRHTMGISRAQWKRRIAVASSAGDLQHRSPESSHHVCASCSHAGISCGTRPFGRCIMRDVRKVFARCSADAHEHDCFAIFTGGAVDEDTSLHTISKCRDCWHMAEWGTGKWPTAAERTCGAQPPRTVAHKQQRPSMDLQLSPP